MKLGGQRSAGSRTGLTAGYGIAVAVMAGAGLLRWVLDPFLGESEPFATFYVAVMLVTLWQGWRPGILATLLGYLIADWFFIAPRGSLGIVTFVPAMQTLVYFLATAALIFFIHRARRSSRALGAANESLHQSEERLQATFDKAAVGIVEVDTEGRFIAANERACEILGYRPGELLGKTVHDVTAPEDHPRSDQLNAELRAGQRERLDLEKRYLKHDGSPLWVHVTASAVRDAAGRPLRFIGTVEDISERKQAEERLRFQLLLTRSIADAAAVCIFVTDEQGRVTFMNPEAEKVFGFSFAELQGKGMHDAIHHHYPDGRPFPQSECSIGKGYQSGQATRSYEEVFFRKDGSTVPVVCSNAALWVEGKVAGAVLVAQDITERKQAEAALREQTQLAQLRADATLALQQPAPMRDLLQQVAAQLVERLDAAFARVWTLDPSGQILELQASAGLYTHLHGTHGRVAVGQLKIGRIAQERRPLVTNQVIGDPHVPEQDWARREGLVAFGGFPLLLEGRLLGVVALFARHPLSAAAIETFGAVAGALAQALGRKQAQEALLRERDFSESAINSLPGVFYLVDADNHLRRWNKNFESISGYSAEEIPRLTALDFLAEEDRPAAAQAIANVFATGEAITELQLLTKARRKLPFVFTGKRLDFDGQSGFLGVGLDISERKEAEAKVARANADLERKVQQRTAKLQETVAELEHFSYTITHDMRAPLRAMRGLGGVLLEECSDCLNPTRREYLRRIAEAADRMDKLITDALQYSGVLRQEFDLEPVDAGALLRGILESYPQFQPPHADIHIEGNLPVVLGNQAAMTQCFSNLLGNAVKFVHPGHTPEVRVWAEVRSRQMPGHPPINEPLSSSNCVRIWFEDKGIGIEKEYHDKIWQMFQQLNKSYEGTGIGLALVRKAVDRMGGRVGVESEPGHGSRFWVELNQPKAAPQPAHSHQLAQGQ